MKQWTICFGYAEPRYTAIEIWGEALLISWQTDIDGDLGILHDAMILWRIDINGDLRYGMMP